MFFWSSLAFSMIQWMLAIWSLAPLPFLNPAWTSLTDEKPRKGCSLSQSIQGCHGQSRAELLTRPSSPAPPTFQSYQQWNHLSWFFPSFLFQGSPPNLPPLSFYLQPASKICFSINWSRLNTPQIPSGGSISPWYSSYPGPQGFLPLEAWAYRCLPFGFALIKLVMRCHLHQSVCSVSWLFPSPPPTPLVSGWLPGHPLHSPQCPPLCSTACVVTFGSLTFPSPLDSTVGREARVHSAACPLGSSHGSRKAVALRVTVLAKQRWLVSQDRIVRGQPTEY